MRAGATGSSSSPRPVGGSKKAGTEAEAGAAGGADMMSRARAMSQMRGRVGMMVTWDDDGLHGDSNTNVVNHDDSNGYDGIYYW